MIEDPNTSTATVDVAEEPCSIQVLTLPKSGITLEDARLIRKTRNGDVIASHPLGEITDLRVVKQLDFLCLTFGLGLASLAVFAKYSMESVSWSWVVSGVVGVLAAVLIIGSWGLKLRVETGGVVAHYNLFDQDEDCQGFHASLMSAWNQRKKPTAF